MTGGPQFAAKVMALDGFIERFKQALPPLGPPGSHSPGTTHDLLVIYSTASAATIYLHRGLAATSRTAMMKCTAAAQAIAQMPNGMDLLALKAMNPIIAVRVSH